MRIEEWLGAPLNSLLDLVARCLAEAAQIDLLHGMVELNWNLDIVVGFGQLD
jgi:hypothetical protein